MTQMRSLKRVSTFKLKGGVTASNHWTKVDHLTFNVMKYVLRTDVRISFDQCLTQTVSL